MVKTTEDFLFSLDYFIIEYGEKMPQEFLEKYGLSNVSEISVIIRNAIRGKKENGLLRLKNIRDYLIECLQYYRRVYGIDNAFESQEELDFVLSNLISDLEPKNFIKIAEIIDPEQIIVIKNLSRRKKLPQDIEREITGFVGKTLFGGYRKKYTIKKFAGRKNTKKLKTKHAKKNKKVYK